MSTSPAHPSHPEIVNRLRRADGHLRAIIEMIETGRSCLDIAQQLQAVEKAIVQAKKTLIQEHIDHCLDDLAAPIPREERARIEEFKLIAKYL